MQAQIELLSATFLTILAKTVKDSRGKGVIQMHASTENASFTAAHMRLT